MILCLSEAAKHREKVSGTLSKQEQKQGKVSEGIGFVTVGEWRVMYVAKFDDSVYVLHAFQKKTQKTRKNDIELAARRYRQIGG